MEEGDLEGTRVGMGGHEATSGEVGVGEDETNGDEAMNLG